jgi:hypothetical protein
MKTGMSRKSLRPIALAALLGCAAASAQSGRGGMSGFVQFEDVAWIEHKHAHVRLDIANPREKVHYETDTNDNGHFDVSPMMMGEYRLAISAPGYKTYETTLYVPSDFLGNIGVILKKAEGGKHSKSDSKQGDAQ